MANNKNGFRILIVDDDDVVRETYAAMFQQKGATVMTAKDGIEAADVATKELPDVIMTGIIMPRMDGFQLINTLRENTSTKDIHVMILSHLGREEDRQRAQELGIDNFIVQGSVTPNEIFNRAKRLTETTNSFRLSFDTYALDAPKLAEKMPQKNFSCPSCQEKIVVELSARPNGGFDAALKCPKCSYIII